MYLRKPNKIKVCTFTTKLVQLDNYLAYFFPDCSGQLVAPLSNVEVKEIIYQAMQNM